MVPAAGLKTQYYHMMLEVARADLHRSSAEKGQIITA